MWLKHAQNLLLPPAAAAVAITDSVVTAAIVVVVIFSFSYQGLLDYLDNLSVSQLRRLFTLLSQLAFCGDGDAGHVADDMHIIIRKQLTNSKLRYKRMGIIGAVAIIGAMAATQTGDSEMSAATEAASQPSTLTGQAYEQVSIHHMVLMKRLCLFIGMLPLCSQIWSDLLRSILLLENVWLLSSPTRLLTNQALQRIIFWEETCRFDFEKVSPVSRLRAYCMWKGESQHSPLAYLYSIVCSHRHSLPYSERQMCISCNVFLCHELMAIGNLCLIIIMLVYCLLCYRMCLWKVK